MNEVLGLLILAYLMNRFADRSDGATLSSFREDDWVIEVWVISFLDSGLSYLLCVHSDQLKLIPDPFQKVVES
jgi:hypothetical protein